MLRFISFFCFLLIATLSAGEKAEARLFGQVGVAASASGSVPFVPVHLYFMAASGCNDSNSGTSAGSPWCTVNHGSLVCGDAIIAAIGTYSNLSPSTNPGTCPSTTGGIDGAGGVYFVSVVCATSFGCKSTNGSPAGINVTANNWDFQGWVLSGTGGRSFQVDASANNTVQYHHVAFINNISANSNQAFDINDGGNNHNVPGNGGDYWAVVGNIAMNSANDGICLGAIDVIGLSNINNTAGTHIFVDGNFSYANRSTCASDVEGFLMDTLDAHGYTSQVIFKNNMTWDNDRWGLQLFYQDLNVSTPTIKISQFTSYASSIGQDDGTTGAEINIQNANNQTWPWITSIINSVAKTKQATGPNGGDLYAMVIGGTYINSGSLTVGGSGTQNIFKASSGVCQGTSCDSGNNVTVFNGGTFGTNTYTDPLYKNTTDLLANHVATPNCAAFTNVTACMGWNFVNQSASSLSVIDDLTPTASGTSGKGYQPPKACAPDTDYPSWLKGVVFLQWNGTSLTENEGLIQKPCGV